ncbi:response regulator transcription factor [Halalkalibacter urbisdiaboli]|uniref:response regulator transcription factor n=1 Tax=Halalkalibacter urbisdiaboli TaxID=1960589 RepID=UPI001FD88681|nr:response regulator [Halalkalibacter urbisdiaboli]
MNVKQSNLFKTIVVEDEHLIRRHIVKKVQELNSNFKVVGDCIDGQEALNLIEEEHPHLVITDIQMPNMNGIELAKSLYFAYPNTKVVILSGLYEFEYARQAIKYRVEDYLLKPVCSDSLQAMLGKIELTIKKDIEALVHASSSSSQTMTPTELVNQLELFIKENYTKNLSLKEIASQLNYSVDYLSKLFKKHRTMTPIKYITHLRMNEAKSLLSSNLELEIKTIGELVGYQDPHYFSKIFKTHTGVYPSEYRHSAFK